MDVTVAKYIKDNGFNILVTNNYISKGVYNSFDNIFSLTNNRSVVSASIGFNLFNRPTCAYITNLFDFLYIYDDCCNNMDLNLLLFINENKLPSHIGLNILNNYNIKYQTLVNINNTSKIDETMKYVRKRKGSGLIVMKEGTYDELYYN